MGTERELLERAVGQAYARQASSEVSLEQARRSIVSRGRRRRLMQATGVSGLFVAMAIGATMSLAAFRTEERQQVADASAIGAEKVMEFGGPIAATDTHLLVANGRLSNDEGDKGSVAVLDLATGEVNDTDPIAVNVPLDVAAGATGLWLVQWTGDMPVGGEGSPVNGRIQLLDPDSEELLLDIPREDSAPYDVAVSEFEGREYAWVADGGRDQILRVDAESGDIEAIQLDAAPTAITAGAGVVWASSNERGQQGTLLRYDPNSGSSETFPVDHCVNDLLVEGNSLWVTDYCDGKLRRFDTATGEELAEVPVGGNPNEIVVADDLLWVSRGTDVVRVDPATGQQIGGPIVAGETVEYLTAAGDTVFTSSWEGVYRLGEGLPIQQPAPSPTQQEERARLARETCDLEHVMCIPLDREWSVAGAGFGTGWVGNVGEGKNFGIARFDAETGDEVARLHTDGFVEGFAPDDRWMWALLDRGGRLKVLKIDPDSTRIQDIFDVGPTGNIGNPSIAVGGGFVWVSQPGGVVTRIAEDGSVHLGAYGDELPGYGASNGPVFLTYGNERLFLSYGTGHLGVVEPTSAELITIHEDALGINAYEITYAAGLVWAPHQTPNGTNVVSFVSTDGDEDGEVELESLPGHLTSDGQRLWALQESFEEGKPGSVVEIDPVSKLVGDSIEVDIGLPGGIAVGDGYVWVTGNKVLYRISVR